MSRSKGLRVTVGAVSVLVLVLLNIVKYWDEASDSPQPERLWQPVSDIAVPAFLTDQGTHSFSRDIFVLPERVEDAAATEQRAGVSAEPPEKVEKPVGRVANLDSHDDVRLLGISRRAGAAMALISYEGRSYYVAEGDVVGGRYSIKRIDESGVYVFTK